MTMLDNKTWTLAERLKRARLLAGLDQAQLAERIGAARNTISNYENGHSEPNVTTFVLWAEATSASLEWLAEGVVRPEGFEPPAYWSVACDDFETPGPPRMNGPKAIATGNVPGSSCEPITVLDRRSLLTAYVLAFALVRSAVCA